MMKQQKLTSRFPMDNSGKNCCSWLPKCQKTSLDHIPDTLLSFALPMLRNIYRRDSLSTLNQTIRRVSWKISPTDNFDMSNWRSHRLQMRTSLGDTPGKKRLTWRPPFRNTFRQGTCCTLLRFLHR